MTDRLGKGAGEHLSSQQIHFLAVWSTKHTKPRLLVTTRRVGTVKANLPTWRGSLSTQTLTTFYLDWKVFGVFKWLWDVWGWTWTLWEISRLDWCRLSFEVEESVLSPWGRHRKCGVNIYQGESTGRAWRTSIPGCLQTKEIFEGHRAIISNYILSLWYFKFDFLHFYTGIHCMLNIFLPMPFIPLPSPFSPFCPTRQFYFYFSVIYACTTHMQNKYIGKRGTITIQTKL